MIRRLAIFLLALVGALGSRAQVNTERVTQVGRNALYFEDYVLAIQYFNRAIEAKPYLAEPYFLRAIAKYNLDDYAGAHADAVKATELNPFLPDAWEVRGVTAQCLDRHGEAVGDYARALELLPHNRNMLFNKALAQEAAKEYAAADSTYAELLEFYPRYDGAYVGRAQLKLEQADTVGARQDLTRALELNPNSVQALTLRAALAVDDPAAALADMEEAVRREPDRAWLRVNRAVARYKANDYNGAIADLDYVLQVDPTNYTALYNRAMLRAELRDNDRALADLNRALQLRPDDLQARYNRAVVLADKEQWNEALSDADAIVSAWPDQYAGYALRAMINHRAGHERAAMADARRADRISRRPGPDEEALAARAEADAGPDDNSTAAIANRFKALQTIDEENSQTAQTFNARGLRGRVQDRSVAMGMLPLYQLSYYTADGDGASSTVYVREIDELNSARKLPFVVFVTNSIPGQTREADAARHFESIRRLSALIESGNATALDRFARAMDRMTLRDYSEAIADIDAVIAATPSFAPAYLLRAAARYQLHESGRGSITVATDAETGARLNAESTLALNRIMDDLQRALELNPNMAVAHYNRGTILMQLGAYADAIDAFNRAIEIEPTLGAAWFNRGYVEFSLGNRAAAIADISHAGQLGISAAYSLLRHLR